jgi:hypothetical protein
MLPLSRIDLGYPWGLRWQLSKSLPVDVRLLAAGLAGGAALYGYYVGQQHEDHPPLPSGKHLLLHHE